MGRSPALTTGIGAFLVYDLLFTDPRLNLAVSDPREWLDLVLLLVVAVAVGRLASLGASRADQASRLAREAQALFAVSRLLSTTSLDGAAPAIVERLARDAAMDRVWIARVAGPREQTIADTEAGTPTPSAVLVSTLVRTPGDEPARWVRSHDPGRRAPARPGPGRGADGRPVPGPNGGRRRGSRVALGDPRKGRRRTEPRGDPAAGARRRPDRAGHAPGAAGRRGDRGRDGAPRGGGQVGPAGLGLARPADAAGQHPGRRRQPDRSGGHLDRGGASRPRRSGSTPRPTGSIGWSRASST